MSVKSTAVFLPTVGTGTSAILNLTPNQMGGPAANLSDTYTSYRISKVAVTIYPFSGTVISYAVAGVSVNVSDVTATGFSAANILTLDHAVLIAQLMTVPQKMTVPSSYLIGANAVKAVKSVAGTPSDWDEVFAQLLVGASGTAAAFLLKVSVWFEFEGLVPTVLTPAPAHTQRDVSLALVGAKMAKYNATHTDTHMEPAFDKVTGIYYDVIKPGPFHLKSIGALPPVVPLIPPVLQQSADPKAAALLV